MVRAVGSDFLSIVSERASSSCIASQQVRCVGAWYQTLKTVVTNHTMNGQIPAKPGTK